MFKIYKTLPAFAKQSFNLKIPNKLLAMPYRSESTLCNQSIEDWMKSLAADKQQRVKWIRNEIALRATESGKIPKLEQLTVSDYEEMMEMTNSRRQRFYSYLHQTKSADYHGEMKKAIREKVKQERMKMGLLGGVATDHIQYGLGKNTLIMKLEQRTVSRWLNIKLHRAIALNEPPLIFDCGFCDHMTNSEVQDAARQLKHSFSENRLVSRPFVMHFCNFSKESRLLHALRSYMPNIEKLPIIKHRADVTEVFPREKLVYLSPDAEEVMEKFNYDERYVVGSIVDKSSQTPLTYAKAKKLNIRAVRLPLDKYIRFHSHKTLTLDQMTKILLEVKKSQDWMEAFKHIPKRKILG